MFNVLRKKRVLAGLGVVAALLVAGIAVAYFTGQSNSDTSSATVGSSTQWGMAFGSPTWSGTLSALYPGAANDTELFPFTVTNNGNGPQHFGTLTPAISADSNGDAKTSGGTSITGCKAIWFTAALDAGNNPLPSELAAGGTYTGKVDVTMPDNSTTNQDPCQGKSPAVTITVS